ncbi:MAG: hypothetical protein IJC76_04850 [Lachnospiraceae bacterium]|nr:hypothetical protein [Lachnospiraceae bacterium]
MLLVEDLESVKEDIKDISSDIVFEDAKYSYKTLNTVITEIGMKINSALSTQTSDNLFSDVAGTVLLDSENKIEVYIEDINDEKIQRFLEEFNYSDMFVFKEAEEGVEQGGSTAPGEYISSSSSGLTAGFRVRRTLSNGVVETGFLTCAHGNTYGDSIKDSNGNVLGTVTYRAYGGSADISFVKLNNSSSVSNTLSGTSYYNVSTTASTPVSGKIVYLFGAKSGKTYGKIESTNVSFTYNNQYFSNLIGASYPSASGDSGGAIVSDYSNYTYNTMGIHRGIYLSYHVFTSYTNVKNTFNLTRY